MSNLKVKLAHKNGRNKKTGKTGTFNLIYLGLKSLTNTCLHSL